MNTLEAIRTRRSIREYTDQPVSHDAIEELLNAAMNAPSAANEQPWQFIVIDDRNILDRIPTISPYAEMCTRAQVAVLVCADLRLLRMPDFWVQDCAAATENLLLAAHEIGLGAVWTGVYPVEDRVQGFRTLFSLPDHIVPFALVPIGHPASVPSREERDRKDRIHHNTW